MQICEKEDETMVESTVYRCEFCDAEFFSETDCSEHERTHVKNYSDKSDREVAEDLLHLEGIAYDHRIGGSVMGIPIGNFENLMHAAASRLLEREEPEQTKAKKRGK